MNNVDKIGTPQFDPARCDTRDVAEINNIVTKLKREHQLCLENMVRIQTESNRHQKDKMLMGRELSTTQGALQLVRAELAHMRHMHTEGTLEYCKNSDVAEMQMYDQLAQLVDEADALMTPNLEEAEAAQPQKAAEMIKITEHQINECNRAITLYAGGVGPGGAHNYYEIQYEAPSPVSHGWRQTFTFQNGPITEGINGITHEIMLAILCHRITGFQTGPFACAENDQALFHLREVQRILKERTDRRITAGIEGTHKTD